MERHAALIIDTHDRQLEPGEHVIEA